VSETISFNGQVAIVTGAGSGLGRAYALELARRGARLVVNDAGVSVAGEGASAGPAADVARQIREAGGEAVPDANTVATREGGAALVQTALDTYGDLHVVVNSAGILRDRRFEAMDHDAWRGVLDVHLNGSFHVAQAAWRHMIQRRYGRIVCTSSGAGLFGNAGHANYSAAKMGIVGLARALAVEGAPHGITANLVVPVALTRMSRSKGDRTRGADVMGSLFEGFRPDLVAPLVAWLAHESCETTGEIFSAAGGRIARIFVAETHAPVDKEITAERVRDAWADIRSPQRAFEVPASMSEELEMIAADINAEEPA
jgi:NAD(P)-dependent dehydrogenase (short-subunit alcohol dehydrogenase family)